MSLYLFIILGYLLVLTAFNFLRAKRIQSQEDFMVAGRKLSLTVMVFTLICTWIGSGTFIAGAEYAAKAGWSSLWLPAGAWVGIAVIYFLAAKIRTFGQYTVGDILEVRYGKFARLFGAVALIIAFTTIVSYQFRAGGYILNIVTDGGLSVEMGQALAALFVILFTALGGMMAVAHTDLPNGIIILLACCVALPFIVVFAGGFPAAAAALPVQHFAVFSSDFGQYPFLKALSYFLATMMLLLGVQSMYQKFYSAKTPREAKKAVGIWIVGTILVETLVVAIAIYSAAAHWKDLKTFEIAGRVKSEVASGTIRADDALPRSLVLAGELEKSANVKPGQAEGLRADLEKAFGAVRTEADAAGVRAGIDPASVVLQAARDIGTMGIVGLLAGLLLLGAACAVVLSTGMNYLLSPSTNIMRDIYQRFLKPDADQKRLVALQKVFIVILGTCAFLMIFIPTVLHSRISVLRYAYFAYTMYGVAITPALLAALTWKRATKTGGILSITSGALMAVVFELVIPNAFPSVLRQGDPWGVPSIYPALAVSLLALIFGSLLSPKPKPEDLAKLFPAKT
ncbi:MAG: sodium:solute symporter family protein [Candidatus Aminicenantes bacterium]|nr:sodium:solute symporter family protein [Candidatus Aminicenantes bacterium]